MRRPGSEQDRSPGVAERLAAFVGEHGGPATAVLAYLGRSGARIIVVAGDGLFTDAVVPSLAVGQEICDRAGIAVGSWTREVTGAMTLSAADRRRMAGTGR